MRLQKTPIFRNVIVPWYDSEAAGLIMIAFMLAVFLFGLAGVFVARGTAAYKGYVWVPILLMIMSGGVMVSTIIRLIKRYALRFSK